MDGAARQQDIWGDFTSAGPDAAPGAVAAPPPSKYLSLFSLISDSNY